MTSSPWKKIRYRFEWLGIVLLTKLVPLFPRRIHLATARGLGWLAYYLDAHGRNTAIQNLLAAHPGKIDLAEARRITHRSYQSFGRTFFDHFWTPRLTPNNFTDYIEITCDDPKAFEKAKETGAIWVCPHYSNFEWYSIGMGYLGFRVLIIAQEFKNPLLTGIFRKTREQSGATVIPQQHSMLRLMKYLKRGGHAGFLTDLTMPPGKAATVIECMGMQACVTNLHANLARRCNLPIFPGICLPRPDGSYHMHFSRPLEHRPGATVQEVTQQCWDIFEPAIRETPEHWMWMYKHWRYRPRKGEIGYPPYANCSKKFDKLLEAVAAESAPPRLLTDHPSKEAAQRPH